MFREAIKLSGKQKTLLFELDAALSLHYLLEKGGKSQEGLGILNKAFTKFKEGSSTEILLETKRIIEGNGKQTVDNSAE